MARKANPARVQVTDLCVTWLDTTSKPTPAALQKPDAIIQRMTFLQSLRNAHRLTRFMLVWFALFIGVAVASPLVKPAPESYEILASGVADGTFFPSESIKSFNLDKVVKHATIFPGGFYSSAFGFFMNEEKWNKLAKQDQDAIMSVSGEALARLAGKAWDAADKGGMDALKAAGVNIQQASPAFIAEVRSRTEPLANNWIQSANAKGLDGAKVLAEFREEIKKAK